MNINLLIMYLVELVIKFFWRMFFINVFLVVNFLILWGKFVDLLKFFIVIKEYNI